MPRRGFRVENVWHSGASHSNPCIARGLNGLRHAVRIVTRQCVFGYTTFVVREITETFQRGLPTGSLMYHPSCLVPRASHVRNLASSRLGCSKCAVLCALCAH